MMMHILADLKKNYHQQCVYMLVIEHCNKKIQMSGCSCSLVSAANPEVTENFPTTPLLVYFV
jgi:hypothetical protein